jgi:hypothetical protein
VELPYQKLSEESYDLVFYNLLEKPNQRKDLHLLEMTSEFTIFRFLPTEIRLKIWRLTLPFRVVDARLDRPSPETGLGYERRPRVIAINSVPPIRPSLPVALHICRESRDEALSIYRPCAGTRWRSPHAYPHNLWNPERDVLFIPMEFPSHRVMTAAVPGAVLALSPHDLPRGFILDQLAAQDSSDVAAIQRLAICWADLYLQDVSDLALALEPFRALKELSIVFYDMSDHRKDGKGMPTEKSLWSAKLERWEDGVFRGAYMNRRLSEMVHLAKAFNERFIKVEQGGEGGEVGVECKKWPEVTIKVVIFET